MFQEKTSALAEPCVSDDPLATAEPPAYLRQHYWWAYVHPNAVRVFERPWLVNLILWGQYHRLRDAALTALGEALPGRTLQVACCYGDLTERLLERVGRGHGTLDVVDVLPVQLDNLRRKLPDARGLRLGRADSSALPFPDRAFDRVLLFFLLHEQPEDVRRRTLAEALRVVRPGGSVVIVDFATPSLWHPLRWLWLPVLSVLEPFAPSLWRTRIRDWLPPGVAPTLPEARFFGGLYQMASLTVREG